MSANTRAAACVLGRVLYSPAPAPGGTSPCTRDGARARFREMDVCLYFGAGGMSASASGVVASAGSFGSSVSSRMRSLRNTASRTANAE